MQTITNIKNATTPQVLEMLRARTKAVHQRLHVHPLMQPLAQDALTQAQYTRALQAFERFHTTVEQCLAALPNINGFEFSPNSPAIINDLNALSAGPNPLPVCSSAALGNMQPSVCSALGMLYVIEGSKLGGQVMARNIHQCLGYAATSGASFFSAEGRDTAKNWKEFLSILMERVQDEQACTDAACATFTALEDWLWLASEASSEEGNEGGNQPAQLNSNHFNHSHFSNAKFPSIH